MLVPIRLVGCDPDPVEGCAPRGRLTGSMSQSVRGLAVGGYLPSCCRC